MTQLQVKDLHTYFYTRQGILRAVNGVSFHVNPGETLGIVGESGCGKSMTALSIMRLVPLPGKVVSGEILLDDKDLLSMSPEELLRVRWKRIAMIFQDPLTSLNPVLTIGKQIREALELHLEMTGNQANNRAVELLSMVGIADARQRLNNYPHQFSGGMRQRVMIAMALSCDPELLIADEPTTALDVTIQAQIVNLVKRLRKELDMAIIWITHDLRLLAGLADRMIVMYAGHVVEEALVEDLYENPRHPYTLGLLGSLPRLDQIRPRLQSIEGMPPNLLSEETGCPFRPRCKYGDDRCTRENSQLRQVGPNHWAACLATESLPSQHQME
jgi:oligopeptide transport system ATP-binding protein